MASANKAFTVAQLFGGAITADIPTGFIDASHIRQIPDNQEVFLDNNGLASITFDLTERVEASDTQDAIATHLAEVVGADNAEVIEMVDVETVNNLGYVYIVLQAHTVVS
jgi:Ran-interacting Mog1 protein